MDIVDTPATLSASELRALLLADLQGTSGRDYFRWSMLMGPVDVLPLATHPDSNWRLRATGSGAEIASIEQAAARVRADHPHARR